ncbi:hypothetical protein BDY17DRAFT_248036 [Neohortaea acidophila]|uniref:Xylanolytic transcriptional activator regulatory domain-containing protein n=1 Tax=Neohortaea acidophila TaxID=245834 RepID=A0A6A6PYI6_9PEZI|nr:uncharacterized protein BDY17DRAFT_248036 [Neohortaea acidophila]KAF2484836.1 hypothetical protein BDY17DRAFT_248036 [Neohortaea acidophila]
MKDSQPPCTRCKKRGLPCTVNKSLQMLLESDSVWKEAIERKIHDLETGLTRVSDHLSLPTVNSASDEDEHDDDHRIAEPLRMPPPAQVSPQAEKHTPHNFEIVMDPDSGPAAIPGSVVSPVLMGGVEPDRAEHDVIRRGCVTLEEAQRYLDVYQNRLDHFLYRIIGDRRTLAQVRAASPLLLAAICAVGALHLASPAFEKCYEEFVAIAAAHTFSRRNTVDDVRGLCVAAFWLSSISWTCIAAAVRISTEIQLHRSIFKALTGDRTHYLRTRLYYLVYVCDHHFSIVFGRPPMTREDDAIRAAAQFLDTENAVEDDSRLVSQVHFWSVGSEIYATFGIDVERPLTRHMIEPLRRYGIKLDNIRADWTERFSYNKYVGNYPRKGVGLHYHFARLYLCSMAFRGIGQPGFKSSDVALDIDEIANSAILSATAILRAVVTDTEIQSYLNGLPTYFDVMIAFAVVFVLKVSTKYSSSVRIDSGETRQLVAELVSVLKGVTASMHPRHLLASVAHGAEKLLAKCSPQDLGPVPANAHITMSQPTFDEGLYDMSYAWNDNSFDNFYMGEFDFLSNQDTFSNFQPDLRYQSLPQL